MGVDRDLRDLAGRELISPPHLERGGSGLDLEPARQRRRNQRRRDLLMDLDDALAEQILDQMKNRTGVALTSDGKWIAIACTSDQMFVRLAEAMEQPELASVERFGPKELRLAARKEVNKIVANWVASFDCQTVLARCTDGGVPASLIFCIADIFEDPQYRARGNIRATESRIGELAVPEVVSRLSGTPGEIRWLGEGLGAQNTEIFGELLGLDRDAIGALREQGVI